MPDIVDGFRPAHLPAPFIEANGPLYWKAEGGFLQLGFRVERRHANAAGMLHGGMLMTLVDMQLNCALNYQLETGVFIPTVAITVDFIAPAERGEWVQGQTEILKRGGSTVFADCRISKGDGALVARASGIFKLTRGGDESLLDPRKTFR